MKSTLRATCDKVGQIVILLLVLPGPAEAADRYKAQRFDVIVIAADGGVDVTESITFEFQSGSFTKVWRDIPTSRTDGFRFLDAAMDGVRFHIGSSPGQITVRGATNMHAEWHFLEVGPSVHRFNLHYFVRGVVYREGESDILRWRALPHEHRYAIDASRISFSPAAGAIAVPLETRRIASASTSTTADAVIVDASGIQPNGWLIAELRYPAGRLARLQPQWLVRSAHAQQLAPKWALAAIGIFATGLVLVVLMRQGYAAPDVFVTETTTNEPPEALPAALAAVLTAKGRNFGYQGMATLLHLANRGVLTVHEQPRRMGVRTYEFSQVPGQHDLESHETAAIDIAFAGQADDVSLSKAQGRLARAGRRFRTAVNADLAARGLLDESRTGVRARLSGVSIAMLIGAALGSVAAAPFIWFYQGWPFLLPLALLLAGLVGVIVAATMTPLSDQGLIEAARWRGFKRHLKSIADGRDDRDEPAIPEVWLVYGIAVGLGYRLSRYLKRHPAAAPPWFIASPAGDSGGFANFVGGTVASTSGGGAHASGGAAAAGGGSSGAG